MAGLRDFSSEEIDILVNLAYREKQHADRALMLAQHRVLEADRVLDRLQEEAINRRWEN